MEDHIAGYAAYLAAERHSSANTIASYVRDVTQFDRYLQEEAHIGLTQCRDEDVERYMPFYDCREIIDLEVRPNLGVRWPET